MNNNSLVRNRENALYSVLLKWKTGEMVVTGTGSWLADRSQVCVCGVAERGSDGNPDRKKLN